MHKKRVITCEDIDVLVLLTALSEPVDKQVYFLKLAKKTAEGTVKQKIYSNKSLDDNTFCKENILLIHAMSGCNTTSSLYSRAIIKAFNAINEKAKKDNYLKEAVEKFKNFSLSKAKISEYGLKIILAIYNID